MKTHHYTFGYKKEYADAYDRIFGMKNSNKPLRLPKKSKIKGNPKRKTGKRKSTNRMPTYLG